MSRTHTPPDDENRMVASRCLDGLASSYGGPPCDATMMRVAFGRFGARGPATSPSKSPSPGRRNQEPEPAHDPLIELPAPEALAQSMLRAGLRAIAAEAQRSAGSRQHLGAQLAGAGSVMAPAPA